MTRAWGSVVGRDGSTRAPMAHTKEMRMTRRRNVLVALVLPVALVLAQAGCSRTKIYRASEQMCAAHGGKYSAETQKCAFAAGTTVSAQQACQDQAGIYMEQVQRCEFSQ